MDSLPPPESPAAAMAREILETKRGREIVADFGSHLYDVVLQLFVSRGRWKAHSTPAPEEYHAAMAESYGSGSIRKTLTELLELAEEVRLDAVREAAREEAIREDERRRLMGADVT